jgi:hypothetical protein
MLSEHVCVNDLAITMRALCAVTASLTPMVAGMFHPAAVTVLGTLTLSGEAVPRSILAK